MKYQSGWKIKIIDTGYKLSHDVYIFREAFGKTEVLNPDGTVASFSREERVSPRPFMEMDAEMMQEMSDAISKIGIRPQKGFIEGKLEATESHLRDMRTLMKLK